MQVQAAETGADPEGFCARHHGDARALPTSQSESPSSAANEAAMSPPNHSSSISAGLACAQSINIGVRDRKKFAHPAAGPHVDRDADAGQDAGRGKRQDEEQQQRTARGGQGADEASIVHLPLAPP